MGTPGRPLDDRTRQQATKLKQSGTTVSEIARRLDLSRPTVRKILKSDVDKFPERQV